MLRLNRGRGSEINVLPQQSIVVLAAIRRQRHHLPPPHQSEINQRLLEKAVPASCQVERKPKCERAGNMWDKSKLLLFSQGNLQNANQHKFMQTRLVCLPLCSSPCVLWCVSYSKVIASCMDPDSAMVTGRAKLSVKIIMAPRWWASCCDFQVYRPAFGNV